MYAAGKIPGSFFKREGRAGEKAPDRPADPSALPQGLAL
jgi:polyribonucleotide nucleotidyltransferase